MRVMRVLLLVATATFSACGGDGTPQGRIAPPGRFEMWGVNGTQVQNATVSFIAAPGQSTPSTQSVSLYGSPEVYITASQTGEMFGYSMSSSGVSIYPAAPLDTGTYSGTVTVSGCYIPSGWPCDHVATSPRSINVSYTVHGLSVTPAQLTFTSTGPATQSASLSVTGGSTSYTSQIAYSPSVGNWLQVAPSSGTPDLSTGPVLFTINAAGLPAGAYGAVVTFTTASSFSARIPVTLLVGDPSVNFIAPYVVTANAGGDVIIRGRGFSSLDPNGLTVQFNATPASSASLVSDTEIRATHPPLTAGSYSIAVSSNGASIPSRAALKLVVVNPPASTLTTIARPASADVPDNAIYDAERHALLFTAGNNRILRYSLADNTSATSDPGPVGRIALSPDGTELIRTNWGQIQRLDPVTLAALPSGSSVSPSGMAFAFANDGGFIGGCAGNNGAGSLCRYDMLAQASTFLSLRSNMWSRHALASADGNTLVLPYMNGSMEDSRVYTYNASSGALVARPGTVPAEARPFSVSRNGSRIILANLRRTQTTAFFEANSASTQTTVYDGQFNVLGTLPADANPVVLSPDGSFAYGYTAAGGQLRKFSITGSGVSEAGGSVVAPANTSMSDMTISPDGGTLFLVGRTSVVIAPAP